MNKIGEKQVVVAIGSDYTIITLFACALHYPMDVVAAVQDNYNPICKLGARLYAAPPSAVISCRRINKSRGNYHLHPRQLYFIWVTGGTLRDNHEGGLFLGRSWQGCS